MYSKIFQIFSKFDLDINFNRFIVLVTLMISVIVSSLTFWSLTIFQEDSMVAGRRFCKDLGLLLASNIIDSTDINHQKDIAFFLEKVYLSTASIRYILFFDQYGDLLLGLPIYNTKIQNTLQLHQSLLQLENKEFLFNIPLINSSKLLNHDIIDILIPLTKSGHTLGSLDLGIDLNTRLAPSRLIRDLSIFVFVLVWLMLFIAVTFNTLAIAVPQKHLLLGIQNIASGNFHQRLSLPPNGTLAILFVSFNEMAEKLQSYEKKNVDKIISEKNKLETIVSIIADGTILVDAELRILFVNKTAQDIFNLFNIDLTGVSICNYLPIHVSEALLPILNKLVESSYISTNKSQTEEVYINLDYSSRRICRFLLTTLLDRILKVLTGVVIIIQDISKEAKLNEAKNQFIGNISHELRTPLCNIGSFLETLIDYNGTLDEKEKIDFLTIANNETKRLSSLVNDILDLSVLQSEYDYKLDYIDLAQTLYNVVKTSQIVANKNNIQLIIELEKNINYVLAHESSILQVISNLFNNALKFSPCNSKIVLRVYKLIYPRSISLDIDIQNLIRFEIIDEGIGIAEEDQKAIFDRFVRVENNVHTLEGTGLGLSIVKNILSKYNIDVIVQSQLNVGTSIWFNLKCLH
uniref:drug sensory protein A n=1 Tax=Gracilaria cliftonii TaxID=206548 RepID=UPI001D110916|nr:drug sensory protein A [Gracilaria cliftonii]UAD84511.1 drug sensory protein A [Gracilaria cliftonii]